MKIVLAVDGSDQSYYAARSLEHLAKMAKVVVVHALDLPLPSFPTIVPEVAAELDRKVERKLREEAERVLTFVGSILPPHAGPVTKRLEIGKPADMILDMAQAEKADLIVLGARGLGPVQELLLGSVSHRVVTHAPCSVLVVNKPLASLRHVLLALQGSDDAEVAITLLVRKPFKEAVGVKVLSAIPHALSLSPPDEQMAGSFERSFVANVQRFVDDVATKLVPHGYRAAGIVSRASAVMGILEEADKGKPDMVMIGASRSKGLSRVVLGSVSHAVLHRSPCPVLVFR